MGGGSCFHKILLSDPSIFQVLFIKAILIGNQTMLFEMLGIHCAFTVLGYFIFISDIDRRKLLHPWRMLLSVVSKARAIVPE